MLTITAPEGRWLVGNPIIWKIETDNSNRGNYRLEMEVERQFGFEIEQLVTLSGVARDGVVYFNLGQVLPLTFERPHLINQFGSQRLTINSITYFVSIREYFGSDLNTPQNEDFLFGYANCGNGRDILKHRGQTYDEIRFSNNFLSYQPHEKIISTKQVEYINTAKSYSKLYIKVYLSDSSILLIEKDISVQFFTEITAIGFHHLELDTYNTDTEYVTCFEVSVVPIAVAVQIGYYYRYIVDYSENRWESKTFVFINTLGGYDTVTSRGKISYSTKATRQTRVHPELLDLSEEEHKVTSLTSTLDTVSVNFGWLAKEQRLWLRDLVHSKRVWEIDYVNEKMIPVTVSTSSLNLHKDDEQLQSVKISFDYTQHQGL